MALRMQPSDAGVHVGSLVVVDPPGWDPFRQTIVVDAAGPAFLEEVGVVVSAEQGEVVEVGWSAVYPVQDVMPVAVAGWMGAAGE